jgi:hypothetical protein
MALYCTGSLLDWYCFAAGIAVFYSFGTDVSEERDFLIFNVEFSRVSYGLPLLCNVEKVKKSK